MLILQLSRDEYLLNVQAPILKITLRGEEKTCNFWLHWILNQIQDNWTSMVF